jgi:hypothetical protein
MDGVTLADLRARRGALDEEILAAEQRERSRMAEAEAVIPWTQATKEAYRRRYLDPLWPSGFHAWRLCVIASPALHAEMHSVFPVGEESVLFEGSRGRCQEIFEEAQQRLSHAGEGEWCLRQVRLEPYGEAHPLTAGA